MTLEVIFEDEDRVREARLESMRAEYTRMSRAIPSLSKEKEPGYPPSNELKQEVTRLQNDLEQHRQRLCAEVEVR